MGGKRLGRFVGYGYPVVIDISRRTLVGNDIRGAPDDGEAEQDQQ